MGYVYTFTYIHAFSYIHLHMFTQNAEGKCSQTVIGYGRNINWLLNFTDEKTKILFTWFSKV